MRPSTVPAGYRADIEGLRGIAVLSVFAVHSVPDALRGGFIGVDVFFVLSGYLISSITLRELEAGSFSIAGFYAARLRRLLPSLLVVLLACLGFAAFWAVPSDARAIGAHVAGGAAFVSNLLLWREGGYFDVASGRKLLLHLWSLGIEEQFYLLWPLALPLLFKTWRNGAGWVLAAALASFALNVAFVDSKPKGVFYLPVTRFWELLVGVLLAYVQRRPGGGLVAAGRRLWPLAAWWQRCLPDLLANAGVVLLALALWFIIDKTDHFPGWWALFPTLATLLLIAAGNEAWINRVVLQHPMLTFYGRISYPLYLWHWPLLTMPLLLDVRLDWQQQVMLLCGSVGLAVATHFAVERPFRFGTLARHAPRLLTAALVLVAGAGAWLVASDGRLSRYPAALRAVAEVDVHADYASYRVERCFLRSEQGPAAFTEDCVDAESRDRPLLVLWGDSHAAALYPGLRAEAAHSPRGYRLAQFTAAACPPGWNAPVRDNPHCREVSAFVLDRIAALRPSKVVLAANWGAAGKTPGQPSPDDVLRQAITGLRARGVQDIVVVGPLPHWHVAPPRILLRAWGASDALPDRNAAALDTRGIEADPRVEGLALARGAAYVSPMKALCNPLGCLVSLQERGQLQATAFDQSHLTAAGSRWLIRKAASALGL